MRILYLIESLGLGGAERRLVAEAKYQLRSTNAVAVASLIPGGILEEKFAQAGGELVGSLRPDGPHGLSDPRRLVAAAREGLRLCRRWKPDVLHTQLFYADVVGRIIGLRLGIPVVTTVQSSVYEGTEPHYYSSLRKFIDAWSGRIVNSAFVAVSDFVKRSSQERLGWPSEKIRVIHNFIDPERHPGRTTSDRGRLRDTLGLPQKRRIAICVGKLLPPKGQDVVIRGVARAPSWHLVIAGDGPCRGELEQLAESSGLDRRVTWTGNVTDVRPWLRAADAYVTASRSEGFSLALLEAMAEGLVGVVSDIPPHQEAIVEGKTGLVFPVAAPDVLRDCLVRLAEDPGRLDTMGEAARVHALRSFSAERGVAETNALYSTLV